MLLMFVVAFGAGCGGGSDENSGVWGGIIKSKNSLLTRKIMAI